jgi:hypothetical protein
MTITSVPVPQNSPEPLFRLLDPAQAEVDLGPLASLVGTWTATGGGYNIIAVPAVLDGGKETFTLLIDEMAQTITFQAIEALTPDRGGPVGTMMIPGLTYQQTVYVAGQPDQLMHIENGMWLLMPLPEPPLEGSQPPPPNLPARVARLSTIPHGNSVTATGHVHQIDGAPVIPNNTSLPSLGDVPFLAGYTENYTLYRNPNFSPSNPNKTLQSAIEGQTITETTTLHVSTDHGGGVANIPFVTTQADARRLTSTFWIETVQPPGGGDPVMQLQYSQEVDLFFMPRPDGQDLIKWPHVSVATLTKQS